MAIVTINGDLDTKSVLFLSTGPLTLSQSGHGFLDLDLIFRLLIHMRTTKKPS